MQIKHTQDSLFPLQHDVHKKTDRFFSIIIKENGTGYNQPTYQHLDNYQAFHDLIHIFKLPNILKELPNADIKEYILKLFVITLILLELILTCHS